jgi:hypothetical protein
MIYASASTYSIKYNVWVQKSTGTNHLRPSIQLLRFHHSLTGVIGLIV